MAKTPSETNLAQAVVIQCATTIHDMHMCYDTLATTSLLGTHRGVGREQTIIEAPTVPKYDFADMNMQT